MEWQQARPSVKTTAVSSFAPVQSTQRLIYTAAPSDRPLSAVVYPPGPFSLPASVSGSGAGGGGGGGGFKGSRGDHSFRSTPTWLTQLVSVGLRVIQATRETGLGVHLILGAHSVRVHLRR